VSSEKGAYIKMKKTFCTVVAAVLLLQAFMMFGTVSALDAPVITVESASGTAPSTVTVAISIENNPGLCGFEASLSFNKTALEYLGGKCLLPAPEGMEFDFISTVEYGNETGTVIFDYLDMDLSGVAGDVDMYELTFRIKNGAPVGEYELALNISDASFLLNGVEFIDLDAVAVNGKITVEAGVIKLGDINLDGDISAADLTMLARHIAKIELITDPAVLLNADIDKDGDISASDLTKLARHIAKIEQIA
jgi:hypothetical protein